MLRVFLTIDTEFWPRRPYVGPEDHLPDFHRDIHGTTAQGGFGLRYQLDLLNAHGLRAVFLVEPLCAYAVGDRPVEETVRLIQEAGQEVQLHLHPEWLARMRQPIISGRRGPLLHQFSLEEQTTLVGKALEKLTACGAKTVCAFRAGSYGANFDTLRAVAANGLRYDTSHNTAFLGTACRLDTGEPLLQPREICGVWEFPITFVRAFGRQCRPLQLAACSDGELRNGLLGAWDQGWSCAVLVSHSFELIRDRSTARQTPRPDRIAIRRFRRLCRFLEQNRDKFRTSTFAEPLAPGTWADGPWEPLRAGLLGSSVRMFEQCVRRTPAIC